MPVQFLPDIDTERLDDVFGKLDEYAELVGSEVLTAAGIPKESWQFIFRRYLRLMQDTGRTEEEAVLSSTTFLMGLIVGRLVESKLDTTLFFHEVSAAIAADSGTRRDLLSSQHEKR